MTRKLKAIGSVAGLAAALFALSTASDGRAQNPVPPPAGTIRGSVAATVDDTVISTYELRQRLIWMIVSTGVQPTADVMPDLQREALVSLIDEKLESHELSRQEKSRKMTPGTLFVDEAHVDSTIANLARQNKMTVDQFTKELEAREINMKTLREQVRVQASWQQWIYGYYRSRVRISDEAIDRVLREVNASAAKPSYLISEIFLDGGRTGGVDAAMAAGRQLIAQLQQNARFEGLARQYSALPTASQGGDAGWMNSGEMIPEVERVVETLRPGQVTQPIRVAEGVYIVLLRDKRAGAASSMVNLRQVAVPLPADATPQQAQAANAQLLAVRAKATGGCGSLQTAVQGQAGLEVGDLGDADTKDLAPAFREAVDKLQPNQVSEPVRTAVGLHLIALCSRTATGAEVPSRDDVGDRLFQQELALIQRRELRNLRDAAVISQPR